VQAGSAKPLGLTLQQKREEEGRRKEEKKKKRHGGAKEEVPPAGGFAFAACGLRGQRLSREGFAECAERG